MSKSKQTANSKSKKKRSAKGETPQDRLYGEFVQLTIDDPHTHINPHAPESEDPTDILGYHYYTELAHSAGLPREQIEEPGLPPDEKFRRIWTNLGPIHNTIQFSWAQELWREHFGYTGRFRSKDWRDLYDAGLRKMKKPNWEKRVLERSNLNRVFLTNDFDDNLDGFDTERYIPCFRTDDLVFHLDKAMTRERLEKCTDISLETAGDLYNALASRMAFFVKRGAKACAISLPGWFTPRKVRKSDATTAFKALKKKGVEADQKHKETVACFVFWSLAELCNAQNPKLPFDLMIGVNRGVYREGVFQGQDLFDGRLSLIQYEDLFNAFPEVKFPISVLSSRLNEELVAYSWIFPNVLCNGQWWYANTPTYITANESARLGAVPSTKIIGYYSDMYKLEFALPKFRMYMRILANILVNDFVVARGWTEDQALAFGKQILVDNPKAIFQLGT